MAGKTDRELDVVVLGATGFTGSLTAQYLADHAPATARLGIAGRNANKLAAVAEQLGREVTVVEADTTDDASLAALTQRTRVLATTVGPYLQYGEPVVKACAEAGTDYLDLTGEPEFVDLMYLKYDRVARESGARLVHAAGFDSIPHDLGAYFTVKTLAASGPVTAYGVVRATGSLSGGTLHSALNQFSRSSQMQATSRERAGAEKYEGVRSARVSTKTAFKKDEELGYWLIPMPTIDPQIVLRSAAALPVYGETFTYGHYVGTKTLRYAIGGVAGMAGLVAAAQIPPLRNLIGARLPQGEGPSERRRDESWFTVDFVAEGDDRRVRTRVSGGDPGYTETSKMLSEAALSLAFDDNPVVSGQTTTVIAMGEALLRRLQDAGIQFAVTG